MPTVPVTVWAASQGLRRRHTAGQRMGARAVSCPPGVLPHAGFPHQPRSRLCLECPRADDRKVGGRGGGAGAWQTRPDISG